jgi:hypothetical protein
MPGVSWFSSVPSAQLRYSQVISELQDVQRAIQFWVGSKRMLRPQHMAQLCHKAAELQRLSGRPMNRLARVQRLMAEVASAFPVSWREEPLLLLQWFSCCSLPAAAAAPWHGT